MNDPSTYEFGPFRVSVATRVLSRNDLPIALGARTLDLLLALVRRQGQVVTKDELMDDVWPGTYVEENNLPAQIYALRKALDDQPEGMALRANHSRTGLQVCATSEIRMPWPHPMHPSRCRTKRRSPCFHSPI